MHELLEMRLPADLARSIELYSKQLHVSKSDICPDTSASFSIDAGRPKSMRRAGEASSSCAAGMAAGTG